MGLGETALTRISVFMNVFDVHVNRSPTEGEVAALAYRPGRFFNASLDKASEFNERQAIRISTAAGPALGVVQIAGLIARRIRCDAKLGDSLRAGQSQVLLHHRSHCHVLGPCARSHERR